VEARIPSGPVSLDWDGWDHLKMFYQCLGQAKLRVKDIAFVRKDGH